MKGHAGPTTRFWRTLYKGIRLLQVLETVYVQGKKDGARAAFDVADEVLVRAQEPKGGD